jgi:hypothetical protein
MFFIKKVFLVDPKTKSDEYFVMKKVKKSDNSSSAHYAERNMEKLGGICRFIVEIIATFKSEVNVFSYINYRKSDF